MKTHTKTLLTALAASALLAGSAFAAPIYSKIGAGEMARPETEWTSPEPTLSSIIFEVVFDYTAEAAGATGDLILFEVGGGSGSAFVLNGANITYYARNSSTSIVGAHGLASPTLGVQVVGVADKDASDVFLYVNGTKISENLNLANSNWAGNDISGLGQIGNASVATGIAYPNGGDANFSFNAYLLGDGSGNTHTVESVLVPEPGSLALLAAGGLLIASRRRRD